MPLLTRLLPLLSLLILMANKNISKALRRKKLGGAVDVEDVLTMYLLIGVIWGLALSKCGFLEPDRLADQLTALPGTHRLPALCVV